MTLIRGRAWTFGDDIDTDAIVPGTALIYNTPEELARFTFSNIRPSFPRDVMAGDIVVGGRNFGCGSSREHAPLALIGSGVSCVVAASFARIFFRNAVNIGLPLIECPNAAKIREGDILEIDAKAGTVSNLTSGERDDAVPVPDFLLEIISDGGLLNHARKTAGIDQKRDEGRL